MQAALLRAMRAVPSDEALDYAIPGKRVALRVVSRDCDACHQYKGSPAAAAYETALAADVVLEVSADHASAHRLASRAGVTKLPAYVVVAAATGHHPSSVVVRYPNEAP